MSKITAQAITFKIHGIQGVDRVISIALDEAACWSNLDRLVLNGQRATEVTLLRTKAVLVEASQLNTMRVGDLTLH
jgi:hypothetical protein